MIRLLNTYFPFRTVFLGVSETCLVMLAFIGAVVVRMGGDAHVMLWRQQGYVRIVVVTAALVLSLYYFDLYESMVLTNQREIITRLLQVFGVAFIVLGLLYHMYPILALTPGVLLPGLVLVAFTLFSCRRLFSLFNAMPRFARRTLILGDGALADLVAQELTSRPEIGARVIRETVCLTSRAESENGEYSRQDYAALVESLKGYQPACIIVALDERRGRLPVEALLELKNSGIEIREAADYYEAVTGRVHVDTLRGSHLLFSTEFQVSRLVLLYKRVASIILSTGGLIVTAPLMLMIAIAIRADSSGPAIFRQKRVGHRGQVFTLYKFRTMFKDVDDINNYRPAESRDSRVTRLGRCLRRARLDELPQLINVLRGDMNFIGPRPFVLNQEQECVERIAFYPQRWVVKPGATGWAQVNRGYNVTIEDNKEKLEYDLFYIKHLSLGLDLLILLQTLKIVLLGRGSR